MKGMPRMKKLGGPLGAGLRYEGAGSKTAAHTGACSDEPLAALVHCASTQNAGPSKIFNNRTQLWSMLGQVLWTVGLGGLQVRMGLHAGVC